MVSFANPGCLGSPAEFKKHYEAPILAGEQRERACLCVWLRGSAEMLHTQQLPRPARPRTFRFQAGRDAFFNKTHTSTPPHPTARTGREPGAPPAAVALGEERSTELSSLVNQFILRR